jgi:hypothetical protein
MGFNTGFNEDIDTRLADVSARFNAVYAEAAAEIAMVDYAAGVLFEKRLQN